MFTGIVEEIGSARSRTKDSLIIAAKKVLEATQLGDSISVNGVCLTVIDITKDHFAVELMPETMKLSNLGLLKHGDKVNLERALFAQGRFGGHFVQGHVDGTGKLVSLEVEEKAVIATFSAVPGILHYLVKKCFIAVNGVSLTVINCDSSRFSVSLVTYTRANSNLGSLRKGDVVNLEVDIIAKYIEKFYHPSSSAGLTELLKEYDYLEAR